jgi:rhodanese-related sulfurtransferase
LFAATAYAFFQRPDHVLVPSVSSDRVLELIRAGKTVVFIDAREREEYAEYHIPGAISLTLSELRALGPEDAARLLGQPDLIVSYCLRDFRGYEVARALQELGYPVSSTLAESGIKGWKERGLPTDSFGAADDVESRERLLLCAQRPEECSGVVK